MYKKLQTLAMTFPTLSREITQPGNGNPEELPKLLQDIAMDPFASMGQRCAASFCMHVWNGSEFSLAHAIGKWDRAHLDAWKGWAQDPWFA